MPIKGGSIVMFFLLYSNASFAEVNITLLPTQFTKSLLTPDAQN